METARKPRSRAKDLQSPQFIRTAKALLLRRRTKEAVNLLRRGLNLEPSCDEAALLLCKSLVAIKRLDEARQGLETLLERRETSEVFVLLTRVCQAQGDNAGARDAALRGLEKHPGHRRLIELSRVRVGDETLSGLRGEAVEPAEARATEEATTTTVAVFDETGLDDETPEIGGAETGLDDETPASPPLEPEEGATERSAGFLPPPLPADLSTSGESTPPSSSAAQSARSAPREPTRPGSDPGATVPGVLRSSRLARRQLVVELSDQREPEEDPSASGMTPMPSDELGFDAREQAAHGSAGRESAPDLVSAVRGLVEPPEDEEPRTPRRPLFASLITESRRDPDEVGGPTPPASPAALLKLRELQGKGALSPSPVEAATLPLRPRDPSRVERAPRVGPVERRAGGELRALDSPAPEPTMPSALGPRILIQPELARPLDSSSAPTRIPDEPAPSQAQATRTAAMPRRAERSALARWWPLVLSVTLALVSASTVAGLWVRQRGRAERSLAEARTLALRHDLGSQRAALRRLQQAANLAGRRPEILALAAAVHAQLAIEHGESDLRGAENLVEEAARLDAERLPLAAEDLAVARAYRELARNPLPEAIAHLFKAIENQPGSLRLQLLYGEALIQNGEHYLAGRILEKLPASNPLVLRARARLSVRQGHVEDARRILRTAQMYGLPSREVELGLALLRIDAGEGGDALLGRLRTLAREQELPSRQRAWVFLLIASLQQEQGSSLLARASLARAIALRPVADVEFSYRAGRLLLGAHDLERAQREVSAAAHLSPRDLRIVGLLASVEVAMDRPLRAIRRLTEVSDRAQRTGMRLTLAEAYLRAGQPEQARPLLEHAGGADRARLLRARLHLAEGKPYLAQRELARVEKRRGSLAELELLRGLTALATEDVAGASRALRAAVKADPLLAEAHHQLGLLAMRQGDAAGAKAALRQATVANPFLRAAHLSLAELELRLGDHAAAARGLDQLLALDPGNEAALRNRARAAVEQNADAEPYLRALRVRGHDEAATLLALRQQVVRGECQIATEALLKLEPKHPDDPELPLWIGQCLKRSGNTVAAIAAFERALATRADTPEADLGLSELQLRRGNAVLALAHANAALEALGTGIHPARLRPEVKLQLARSLRASRAIGAAIAELQEILELDRAHLGANLELAELYLGLGQRPRAVKHLREVLRVSPDHKQARAALDGLCRASGAVEGCEKR